MKRVLFHPKAPEEFREMPKPVRSTEDSAALELRIAVLRKIIAEVGKQGLTHAEAAERTGTSRSRMTSILNGAIQDVSTDLLLRVLWALGFRAKVSFAKAA